MRNFVFIAAISGFLSVIISGKTFSQAISESSSQQIALNKAVSLFNISQGTSSPVYNGPEYYLYSPAIKGNAYFKDFIDFTAGSVFYDGVQCNGVPMLYDLNADKVVVLAFDHFTLYSLINEKVKSFDFLAHHFISINADTIVNNNLGLKSGFYDELYLGKVQILAKRSKSIQENAGTAERHFSYSRDFYIRKNNLYYKSGSLNKILDLLKDRKKELQQYIKSSQIVFRDNPEEAMVKIAAYYDHLAN